MVHCQRSGAYPRIPRSGGSDMKLLSRIAGWLGENEANPEPPYALAME